MNQIYNFLVSALLRDCDELDGITAQEKQRLLSVVLVYRILTAIIIVPRYFDLQAKYSIRLGCYLLIKLISESRDDVALQTSPRLLITPTEIIVCKATALQSKKCWPLQMEHCFPILCEMFGLTTAVSLFDPCQGKSGFKMGNSKRQDQVIMEWYGLEETLKITYFQPPCHGQGLFPVASCSEPHPAWP